MICLRCNSQGFVPKPNSTIEQEFRGEVLQVPCTAMACTSCGWETVGLDQLDDLRHQTADCYREKHALLTSDEIRVYREKLEMTQLEFAAFLRVGEASVKRWETWQVQDASSDELIRVKCEQALRQRAEANPIANGWGSYSHFSEMIVTVHGITVEQAPAPKPVAPSRFQVSDLWRDDDRLLEVLNDAANQTLALAA